ncbi:hypothetical protein [Actinoplanes regularis]|uniref:Uncharacterized protein n=1 Tax=Actinoplanes regularis TaxID=52697 RepID=A0A238UUX0_9ACTN|nr:hypothetical protein [Actinoplanes regularis]GIE84365.1 hypothetical protein Are01nite_08450 [Actinoplanes regularis]SNR26015.1 hypothetical protein SAMN06264365_101218 [Actinoplanes regularis]
MSPVRAPYTDLGAVRALIADGFDEIVRTADDLDQFWIRSACGRLAAADAVLATVPGRRSGPVNVLITTVVTAGVAAGSAALARAAGGGLVVALVLAALLLAVAFQVTGLLRRREVAPVRPAAPKVPGPGLVEVPLALERARVRLVSMGLRRAGRANWRVPALRRALSGDPALARIAEADLLLCQAIDCLERYLDDLSKDWS